MPVGASTPEAQVGNMNIENVDILTFLVELTLTFMAADELLREDAVLRAEFSCQVELASFMQWQAMRLLKSAE
jgi:hypothetical protein